VRYFTAPLIPAEAATYDEETGEELTPAFPNRVGVGTDPVTEFVSVPGARFFYQYEGDGMTPLAGDDTVLVVAEGLTVQDGWVEKSPEEAATLFPEAF